MQALFFGAAKKNAIMEFIPEKIFYASSLSPFPKILDRRAVWGEQGRMYSTLEKAILLALSDGGFAALDAPDSSLARAYAASVAADLFILGLIPAVSGNSRPPKFRASRGRVFERSAEAAAECADLRTAARELEKIAPELERLCVEEMLEKSALMAARQFGFFGREVLKVSDARACRKIRESVFAAVSGERGADFGVAALIWALFCGGLEGVALSRAQLRRFRGRALEIADGFCPAE